MVRNDGQLERCHHDEEPEDWRSRNVELGGGHVGGTIAKNHTEDIACKGRTHHASEDEPQHEIVSDRSDHIALHKAAALRRTKGRPDIGIVAVGAK